MKSLFFHLLSDKSYVRSGFTHVIARVLVTALDHISQNVYKSVLHMSDLFALCFHVLKITDGLGDRL